MFAHLLAWKDGLKVLVSADSIGCQSEMNMTDFQGQKPSPPMGCKGEGIQVARQSQQPQDAHKYAASQHWAPTPVG